MKKILGILPLLLCILSGCHKSCPPRDPSFENCIYEFDNQSGHTLAIVPPVAIYPARPSKFDSLVLRHAEQFAWRESDGLYWLGPRPYGIGKIYYDGRYKLAAETLPKKRKIDNTMNSGPRYDEFFETELDCYTYTFTGADYDYAVEHGVDLQPEQ